MSAILARRPRNKADGSYAIDAGYTVFAPEFKAFLQLASSSAAKRSIATVRDQTKFNERGNIPLLRWDAPPGANATTALTRGSESDRKSVV